MIEPPAGDPADLAGSQRCAAHPARPAVDECPVCARPRCGADAAAGARGCPACAGTSPAVARRPDGGSDLERLVRGALAAYATALVGGLVVSEYVGATFFAYLGPFVVGVVCAGAATRAAGTDGHRGAGSRLGSRVRAVATVVAVLAVALGFVIEGSLDPVTGGVDVLLPYAAAAAGAFLWTMPPPSRQGRSTDA